MTDPIPAELEQQLVKLRARKLKAAQDRVQVPRKGVTLASVGRGGAYYRDGIEGAVRKVGRK